MKFKKKNISTADNPFYDYGVDLDSVTNENEFAIEGFDWYGWTSEEVQKIIDNSKKINENEEYFYQVEGSDFLIRVTKEEVLMWNRGSRTPDISWSFDKFISFLEDFKTFLNKEKR